MICACFCHLSLDPFFDASFSRDFIDQLRDGSVNIQAGDLPAFLYDESQYTSANKMLGLFRGYFLVRVR
jgi:hypothetical protein